jgi:hypothetical protein
MLIVAACGGSPTSAPANVSVPTESAASEPTVEVATTAPTETPIPVTDTPAPAPETGAACVVGTWEMADMGAYLTSVIPSAAGAEISVTGQEGFVRYTFGDDSTVAFNADNFVMRFAINVSGLALNLDVSIDGTGTATYSGDAAGQLTFSNASTEGLTFSAALNGNELFSGTSTELAGLFGVSPDGSSTSVAYECQGDTLRYTPPVTNAQPVVLRRISQ